MNNLSQKHIWHFLASYAVWRQIHTMCCVHACSRLLSSHIGKIKVHRIYTHTREGERASLTERFDNSIYQKCDFPLASYIHFCIMYMLSHLVIESEVGAYIIWILMNDDVQCSSPLSCKSQIVIFYSWASFRSYPFMHTLIPHSLRKTENFQFAFNAFIDEENSIKIDFTSL